MEKIKHGVGMACLLLCCSWVTFALLFDFYMIGLHVYDNYHNTNLSQDLSNKIAWKIDGTFKDVPGNIYYEEPKK